MRYINPAIAMHLAARSGVMTRRLFWVRARNRITGLEEALGLWDGVDTQMFDIDGEARSYSAGGSLIDMEPMSMSTGLVVRMQRLTVSPLSPEVQLMARGYDMRLAPVEIHRAFFDPDTEQLIAAPQKVFSGWVDEANIPTAAKNDSTRMDITLASAARALTIPLAAKKSDETQKRRSGDRFRRYADVSGNVDVWWGEKRGKIPGTEASPSNQSLQKEPER